MRVRWMVVPVIGMILSLSACSIFDRVFGESKPNVAPPESVRKEPYGPRDRPAGFNAAIAWLNVCQRDRSTEGYALVYSLNLVGVTSTGSWIKIYSQLYSHPDHLAGGFFPKTPWFSQMLEGQTVFTLDIGAMRVPTGTRPEGVYHPWQAKWPRAELQPEIQKILATADIQCFGNAVAQVGADYWPATDTGSAGQPEYEAGASRWISAADGRVTLLLGE